MSALRISTGDRLLALLLVSAFALAGWKSLRHPAAADFATPSATLDAGSLSAPRPRLSNSAPAPSAGGQLQLDGSFVSSQPGQAVHAASLVELRDGSLRAVWFSGSREGASDVAIKSAVMDPVTLKWRDEGALFTREPLERGLWRYVKKLGNPVIARAPDGSLHLWLVTVSLGGWAGSSITWARSVDEGRSWSTPRRLVTSPFLNISTLVKGAPVAFADGRTGLPVYHEFIRKFAEVLRLDAEGRVVDKLRVAGSQTSLQPVVLVTGPRTANVFMRSGNAEALMASQTGDAGQSWARTTATALPNPDSAVTGVAAEESVLWLALNPDARGREKLALLRTAPGADLKTSPQWLVEGGAGAPGQLAIADYENLLAGELATAGVAQADIAAYVASARRQLCGPESCSREFSYPYMLKTRDGHLHLVYTWHRTRIKYVRIDPATLSSHAAATH